MRVVLDTNIIVSRYVTPQGLAAQLLDRWRADEFELIISEPILAEIHEVMLRPSIRSRHQLTKPQVRRIIDNFRRFATMVEPTQRLAVVEDDPDDDKFVEGAVESGADVIVSRDPDLLHLKSFQGIRIMTPAAFLALLEAEGGETP